MIITQIAMSGVGRFRSRHVVRGLGPGLNLLCAPNEAGKSTIFRALRAGLFYRHGSSEREIASLASLGVQLPATIAIGFDREGISYRVEKSFLLSRGARLFKAGQLVAEGRSADEEVWSILGVAPGARSAEEATFGLLWVRQGASFGPVEPSEGARSALARLIENEVGEVLEGARGERVRNQISDYIGTEQTTTGQPKSGGKWKMARENSEALQRQLEEVRRKSSQLEVDICTFAEKLEQQRKLSDPSSVTRMKSDLEAASRERVAADEAQRAAQVAEGDVARLTPTLELVKKKHQELIQADRRISAARQRITELNRLIDDSQAGYETNSKLVQVLEEKVAFLAEQSFESEKEYETIAKLSLAAAEANRLAELRNRLERARSLREQIAAKTAFLRQGVSAATLRKVEELASKLTISQAQFEAKAPQISIQLGADAGHRVRFKGEVIQSNVKSLVLGPSSIEIERIATIELIPVSASTDLQLLAEARSSLETALRKIGVASVAEARKLRDMAEDADAERRGLSAELKAIAPDEDGKDGVTVLEQVVVTAETNIKAVRENQHGQFPSVEDLNARRREVESRRDERRRQHREREQALRTAQSDLASEGERLAALRQELSTLEVNLQTDLEGCPDDRRAGEIATHALAAERAGRELVVAEDKAGQLRSAVPSDEQLAAIDSRLKRLRGAIDENARMLQDLAIEISGLRQGIATRGGEGIGEREASLADDAGIAGRDLARIEGRLAALRLLHEVINECRNEARETYLAPIKMAMKPFLHTVFPGADAQLDETFGVSGLQRSGSELEPFDYLSHGTREQIAVLVRLALGRLLADRGQPIPILLDDALVFSDDDRIDLMFDALTQAAERHQLIVFTCRSRVFQNFGGRRLQIEADSA